MNQNQTERDEAADLRAEVEHWKHHAWEAGEGFKRAIEDGNRARARSRADRDRALKAEAERDALQRQVDAVRALAGEWLVEADRYEGYAAGSRIADELRSIAKTLRQNAAALDAVEPADQPHPGDADVVPAQVVTPESCPNHRPRQHRDGKPPWCELCRRTADGRIPVSALGS